MSCFIHCYAECHYAECHYPERHYTDCCGAKSTNHDEAVLSVEWVESQVKIAPEVEFVAALEDQWVRIPDKFFVLVQVKVKLGPEANVISLFIAVSYDFS